MIGGALEAGEGIGGIGGAARSSGGRRGVIEGQT